MLFDNGIAFDRITGFTELGSKDDFKTIALDKLIKQKWQNLKKTRAMAKKQRKHKPLNLAKSNTNPVWIN